MAKLLQISKLDTPRHAGEIDFGEGKMPEFSIARVVQELQKAANEARPETQRRVLNQLRAVREGSEVLPK